MDKVMYSAETSFGNYSIAKITIAKETKHTISISEIQFVVGHSYQWLNRERTHKHKLNLFDTLLEAIEYLIKKLQDANDAHQQEIAENNRALYKLEAMKNDKGA